MKVLEDEVDMVQIAIKNAAYHGIEVYGSNRIPSDGDCAFSSVIDNINSRNCFTEKLDKNPLHWRRVWMGELEILAYENWNPGMSRQEWKAAFDKIKQQGTYEVYLGDLIHPGIAHCIKKNILIFNTSEEAPCPVHVVPATNFGGVTNSRIPIVLAYNQVHYESLIPKTNKDIECSIELCERVLAGASWG